MAKMAFFYEKSPVRKHEASSHFAQNGVLSNSNLTPEAAEASP
jgi:hypothetical protein